MLKLVDHLVLDQQAVLDAWFDLILGTYSENTAVLWKKRDDPFANPVRHRFEAGMRGIVVGLATCGQTPDVETFGPYLDEIVRVRVHPAWLRVDARFGTVYRRLGDPAMVLR